MCLPWQHIRFDIHVVKVDAASMVQRLLQPLAKDSDSHAPQPTSGAAASDMRRRLREHTALLRAPRNDGGVKLTRSQKACVIMLMKRPMANAFHKWKAEMPDEGERGKASPRQGAHSRSRAREERKVGIECLVSDILNASQRTSTAYYEQQVNGLETAPGVSRQRSKSPVSRAPSNIGRIGSNGSIGRIGSNGRTSSASGSHVRLRIRAEAFQHQPDLTMVQTTVHRRGDAVKHGLEKVAGEEHHQNAEQESKGDAREDGADTAPSAPQRVLYAAERPASGSRHNRLEAAAHVVSKLKHWQWMAHLRQALVSWEAAQRDAVIRRITLLSSDLSGRRNTTRHERWLEAWQEETFKLFNTFSTLETDPEIPACLDSAAFVALLSRTGAIEGATSSPSTAEV